MFPYWDYLRAGAASFMALTVEREFKAHWTIAQSLEIEDVGDVLEVSWIF